MKKLKNCKSNKKKLTPQDQVQKESLTKPLPVCSFVKKKEQAKVKLGGKKKVEKSFEISRESSHSSNDSIKVMGNQNDSIVVEVINCDENDKVICSDDSPTSMDDSSTYLKDVLIVESIRCDEDAGDDEANAEFNDPDIIPTNVPNNECDKESDDVAEITDNVISLNDDMEIEALIENQTHDKTKKNYKKTDKEQCAMIDGFLSRLSEGLMRLPYKQRAKLEIEYLQRLYEVQDNLGIFDA